MNGAYVNRKTGAFPPTCSVCRLPRTVKKTYNAEPDPANGVKMIGVFLCSRCDLAPSPPSVQERTF